MDLKQQLVEKFKQAVSEQGISRADITSWQGVTKKKVSRQAVDNYFHGRCSEQVLIDLLDWMGYSVDVVIRLK